MLRLATIEDIDFLYIMYMHPIINPYLLYEQMDLKTFIQTIEALIENHEIFILENKNISVGMCKLIQHQHRNSHCIYVGGIAIHPNHTGKGFGNNLMQEIILFAKERNKKRIELSVATQNEKAIVLYQKNGFVQEGILKYYTHLISKNEYVDEVMMAYYF
jgi:L-phenylalanine/L-methionine N-acetyltransferase